MSPAGGDAMPPAVSAAMAAELFEQYGLRVAAVRIVPTERDRLLRGTDAEGQSFVLRISPDGEAKTTLELQNAALRTIGRHCPDLTVPRVLSSRNGNDIESLRLGSIVHHFRVLSYLEGEPVGRTERSAAQRAALGAALARLDQGLAALEYPAEGDSFLWNVVKAPQLRPIAAEIDDMAVRQLVLEIIDGFERDALPALGALPTQFIHNDFNPKNVLVDPAEPARITGIIDFGDMMRAPRIVDLAVAVARQVSAADPVFEGQQIVASYHRSFPLAEAEFAVLPACIEVRLAMRIVIWEWRRRTGRGQPMPDLVTDAFGLLQKLRQAAGADLAAAFHRASTGAALPH